MDDDSDSKTISIFDLPKICRVCLNENEEKNLLIFQTRIDNIEAKKLFEFCVSLKIEENFNDITPKHICENCLNTFYQFYRFKKRCYQSEAAFKLLIAKSATEKDEIETIVNNLSKSEAQNNDDDDIVLCSQPEPPAKQEPAPPAKPRRKPLLKCPTCHETFATTEETRAHKKQFRHFGRPHFCPICGKSTGCKSTKEHMRTHTQERPHRCHHCSKRFSNSANLKRHQVVHTGEKAFVCEKCGRSFNQLSSLQTHLQRNTCTMSAAKANTPVPCAHCPRVFRSTPGYLLHLRTHRDTANDDADIERPFVCEVCGCRYTSAPSLKTHKATHLEPQFACEKCGKSFHFNHRLQKHLLMHEGVRPYLCTLCGKAFTQAAGIRSHMLIHYDQKPYECRFCKRRFRQRSQVVYHERVHTGEKKYICPYCDRKFTLNGNLTVHIRTHTGETPYVCPECGKGFYDSSNRKKHMRVVHSMVIKQEEETPVIVEAIESLEGLIAFS